MTPGISRVLVPLDSAPRCLQLRPTHKQSWRLTGTLIGPFSGEMAEQGSPVTGAP